LRCWWNFRIKSTAIIDKIYAPKLSPTKTASDETKEVKLIRVIIMFALKFKYEF